MAATVQARAHTPGREEPAAREALKMVKSVIFFIQPTFGQTPPFTLRLVNTYVVTPLSDLFPVCY